MTPSTSWSFPPVDHFRNQVVRTSVPWRYEVQQIDVLTQGNSSITDFYLSLEDLENDSTVFGSRRNDTACAIHGVSLLNSATSAADMKAALEALPSAGAVRVTRVPTASTREPSVASRHLVTFLTRGGDVPLIKAQASSQAGPLQDGSSSSR